MDKKIVTYTRLSPKLLARLLSYFRENEIEVTSVASLISTAIQFLDNILSDELPEIITDKEGYKFLAYHGMVQKKVNRNRVKKLSKEVKAKGKIKATPTPVDSCLSDDFDKALEMFQEGGKKDED